MSLNRLQKGDYIICFAVFIQPVLILMQHVLIDVFRVDSDTTTTFRVVLTAVPMLLAIAVGAYRKMLRFFVVYAIAFLILSLTILFFPDNEKYIRYEGLRFLLPLVIPTAICLTVVKSEDVLRKALVFMAWLSAMLVFFYAWAFFSGLFSIDSYNMSFSYGCLLPMIVLYSQRRWIPTIVSLFIFLVVIAIGSRGGAAIFIAYVIVDAIMNRRKERWIVLVLGIVLVLSLPLFMAFLERVGIGSRTLRMLNSGDIAYDSGRNNIYAVCLNALNAHPVFGVGLYGDRVLLEGAYCHNFFLEISMDFGLILGLIILCFLLLFFIRVLWLTKGGDRNLLMVITFGCFLPFMVSGSYLISNSIAIWIGVLTQLNRKRIQ